MDKHTKFSDPSLHQCKSDKHRKFYLEGSAKRIPISAQGICSPHRVPIVCKREWKCQTPMQTSHLTPQKQSTLKCSAASLLENASGVKSTNILQTVNHLSCSPETATPKTLFSQADSNWTGKDCKNNRTQTAEKATEKGVQNMIVHCSARRVPTSNQRLLMPHRVLVAATSESVPETPSGRQPSLPYSASRKAVDSCPSNITPRMLFSQENEYSPAVPKKMDVNKLKNVGPLNTIPESILARLSPCDTEGAQKQSCKQSKFA
ncbi:hypothetical protein O6H91_13G095000 [Diphasiastrum complanatum]|uniref:Uncharacterized protein n=2 Tax=Diphasiastrum complanatum TaxID=34168 RepID=A0ACC2BXC3_DIPCM|nr:hypothetical protein O6H91_13G095000 [Diphasiastrum complanatum]